MKKSVVVVEDDAGLREQLAKILKAAPDIVFAGAYASAEDALPKIAKLRPSVVLMDIKLPGMSGTQCVAEIKKVSPSPQVIMVTVYEDSESIFSALKAGADGYIIKSDSPDQLLSAIRNVSESGGSMSIPIARKVIKYFHLIGASAQDTENLSPREHEVLDLLAQGYTYKEIGEMLKIGTATVRTHVQHICRKMHVRSRLEAVARRQNKYPDKLSR
jgi:DNA-binding NarL/FixJ family response regulator